MKYICRKFVFGKFSVVEIDCQFELSHYPFDNQECLLYLVNQGNIGNRIKLFNGMLSYLGPTTVKNYVIQKVEFMAPEGNGTTIVIKIGFTREVMNDILVTFLPGILICIVSI